MLIYHIFMSYLFSLWNSPLSDTSLSISLCLFLFYYFTKLFFTILVHLSISHTIYLPLCLYISQSICLSLHFSSFTSVLIALQSYRKLSNFTPDLETMALGLSCGSDDTFHSNTSSTESAGNFFYSFVFILRWFLSLYLLLIS